MMEVGRTELSPPMRLPFLDGIRGLAALQVFLHHAIMTYTTTVSGTQSAWPAWFAVVHKVVYYVFLDWGHYAVCVFIVLSGFCLMLPIARDPNHHITGGTVAYLRRRARRILPAYYGALSVTLVLMWLVPRPIGNGWEWPVSIPWQELPTRLLLVHNLVKDHWKLNPPMWSVALEWQIYFLLPAVFLPVWRRAGDLALLAIAGLIAAGPVLLLPRGNNLWWAQTQMVVLFAIGMIAACITAAADPRYRRLREWNWNLVATAALLVLAAMAMMRRRRVIESHLGQVLHLDVFYTWPADIVVGIVCASIIVLLARTHGRRLGRICNVADRALTSRPAMVLGACSYSLYLLHNPMIECVVRVLDLGHRSYLAGAVAYWVVLLPGTVTIAWLFHLRLERPFLGRAAKQSAAASRPNCDAVQAPAGPIATQREALHGGNRA